jgi:pyridoxamine 5'-phosphate oxidase family protein
MPSDVEAVPSHPMPDSLTPQQLQYLHTQRLGRLATVDGSGAPQNNPVGFVVDDDTGQVLIGGFRMGDTRKFRNVLGNPQVALVVDDLASVDPWRPRMVEIRGTAEALSDIDPPMQGMSRDVIRITPTRIISFGLDDDPR